VRPYRSVQLMRDTLGMGMQVAYGAHLKEIVYWLRVAYGCSGRGCATGGSSRGWAGWPLCLGYVRNRAFTHVETKKMDQDSVMVHDQLESSRGRTEP
jgi:hypothetical protein